MRRSHVMMSVWQAVCGHQFMYESLGQKNQEKYAQNTTELPRSYQKLTRSYRGVSAELTEVQKKKRRKLLIPSYLDNKLSGL